MEDNDIGMLYLNIPRILCTVSAISDISKSETAEICTTVEILPPEFKIPPHSLCCICGTEGGDNNAYHKEKMNVSLFDHIFQQTKSRNAQYIVPSLC